MKLTDGASGKTLQQRRGYEIINLPKAVWYPNYC